MAPPDMKLLPTKPRAQVENFEEKKEPFTKYPQQYYDKLEKETFQKFIGESIPVSVREEYIRDWRAK